MHSGVSILFPISSTTLPKRQPLFILCKRNRILDNSENKNNGYLQGAQLQRFKFSTIIIRIIFIRPIILSSLIWLSWHKWHELEILSTLTPACTMNPCCHHWQYQWHPYIPVKSWTGVNSMKDIIIFRIPRALYSPAPARCSEGESWYVI